MPTDVREVLREAAGRPLEPIDAESIWRRARRQNRLLRAGAELCVIAVVGAGVVAAAAISPQPRVEVEPVASEPTMPDVRPEWTTVRVADAQLSVPAGWEVVDLRESPGTFACDGLSRAGAPRTLFTYEPVEPLVPKCGPPGAAERRPGLRLQAYPVTGASAGAHVGREINGHDVQVIEEYATTQFRFVSLGLAVRVTSSGNDELAHRILTTVDAAEGDEPVAADPEGWNTHRVGDVEFAVPASWPVVDLREDDGGTFCTMFWRTPSLYLNQLPASIQPLCAPGPSTDEFVPGVHAFVLPIAEASPDPGQPVSVHGVDGTWNDSDEDGVRRYTFPELGLGLVVSYQADPDLAEQILDTLRPAGDDRAGWRDADLGEATISFPGSWEVFDLREDATAICSRFLGAPALYLWDAEPPPSCPAPSPDAPRSVGVHVTRNDQPFDASRAAEHDAVISIQNGPTLYERDNGDGTRTYRVDGSTLEIIVSYDPDPDVAQRVARSLRFDEPQ